MPGGYLIRKIGLVTIFEKRLVLEVHKLLYFMQEAGEPLKLRLTRRFMGPMRTTYDKFSGQWRAISYLGTPRVATPRISKLS